MTSVLIYLTRKTNEIFETRMQRAAVKISARQQVFAVTARDAESGNRFLIPSP